MVDLMPRAAAALARPASQDVADLLEALLTDGDTVAARALARLGLDVTALTAAVRQTERARGLGGGLEWTRDRWVRGAEKQALNRGHAYVGTEHLLLGLLEAGPVADALAALGSSPRAVRGQVWRTLCEALPGGEWQPDGPGRAPGESAPSSQPHHSALAAIAAEEPVVGMSWALALPDRTVRTAAYGWADPPRQLPVTAQTRFRVGSVTKIATTLLILRLREVGMVDLDEPATAKLRTVRLLDRDGAPSSATVRQLLTHTAGLPRGSGLRHYTGPVPAVEDLFRDGMRADRPAGQWSYSNLGFAALAALAADLLGAPFADCLRDWVLGPLGLAESASLRQLPSSNQPATSGIACGHAFDAGRVYPVRPSAVMVIGAGELVASARDVATLAAATTNGELLSAQSVSEMLVPHTRCGPGMWQGLGVRIEFHSSVRLVGHDGSFPGFDAAVFACPETGGSAALLANTNTGLLAAPLRTALLNPQPG
jgi:CubicO group peptidase (beta-lactamase class C family)